MMLLNDFDYLLPPELIAQNPLEQRDASRLMLLDRRTGAIGESIFHDIPQMFRKGDLLVINDTRVIPARLKGFKDSGGKVEVFLVRKLAGPGETWRCLVKSSKPPKPDSRLFFPEGLEGRVIAPEGNGSWQLSFLPVEDFEERLERGGMVPLPPYIRRQAEEGDKDRYQTVFARQKGAVAAPTAGLHMTSGLLGEMERIGVEVAPVTLHVGIGTFMPVRADNPLEHRMHAEICIISENSADRINRAKREGRRVVALGTTSARAIEHSAGDNGTILPGRGETDIFIYPGYRFKVVDALITNFHLPKSTLMMMVSAFAGRENALHAYEEAVRKRFRFFSYGDAMFIY